MDFEVEREADAPRSFHLVGELDLATSPSLLEAVMPVARGEGDIRLNLKDLSFIDSSGIRAFLVLAEELGTRGRLVLASLSPAVEHTLQLVGIDRADNIQLGDSPSG